MYWERRQKKEDEEELIFFNAPLQDVLRYVTKNVQTFNSVVVKVLVTNNLVDDEHAATFFSEYVRCGFKRAGTDLNGVILQKRLFSASEEYFKDFLTDFKDVNKC